jgi:hypothetical protein
VELTKGNYKDVIMTSAQVMPKGFLKRKKEVGAAYRKVTDFEVIKLND